MKNQEDTQQQNNNKNNYIKVVDTLEDIIAASDSKFNQVLAAKDQEMEKTK